MDPDCLFISVESRKGGVGKTTAALNLARILLEEKDYAVLFIDADVTGTNAALGLASPYWQGVCHPIKHRDQNGSADDAEPANLLELFQTHFMAGKLIPEFGAQESKQESGPPPEGLSFHPTQINVLGSQIYDQSRNRNDQQSPLICEPSILFDELHAFWFIEFLQVLCQRFMQAVRPPGEDQATAFIIDNSPGYVGIAPAVQRWLTDLGPERGKFLTVSSLDIQDLRSCRSAVEALHQLLEDKLKGANLFAEAKAKKATKGFSLDDRHRAFFLRLVEADAHSDVPSQGMTSQNNYQTTSDQRPHKGACVDEDLSYYRKTKLPQRPGEMSASDYQGLVINRVPRDVWRGDLEVNWDRLTHKDQVGYSPKAFVDLLGRNRRKWMVPYDPQIEYQFLHRTVSRLKRSSDEGVRRILRVIETSKNLNIPREIEQLLRHGATQDTPRMTWHVITTLREKIVRIQRQLDRVLRALEENGLSRIRDLIRDEWLPTNCVRGFRSRLQGALVEIGYERAELVPWEVETGPVNKDAATFLERLHQTSAVNKTQRFLPLVAGVAGLSMTSPWWHEPASSELAGLFAGYARVQNLHWNQQPKRGKTRIQKFLFDERLTKESLGLLYDGPGLSGRWRGHEPLLVDLYGRLTTAEARLLDVRVDAVFLLGLIEAVVRAELRSDSPLMPYIAGIANSVILEKTLSHEEAKRRVVAGLGEAEQMEDFCEVLRSILKRWGGL